MPVNAITNPQVLTWTGCTAPATPQTLALAAFALWVDANIGGPATQTATVTAPVTVQAAAAVAVTTLVPSHTTVSTGQTFSVILNLAKTGTAPANVTAVSLSGVTCSTPPTVPETNIPVTLALTWTGCTAPATPQTLSLSAFATWVDANAPGVPHPTANGVSSVSVQAAAALSAAITLPAAVSAAALFSITMRVTNAGGAAANNVTPGSLVPTGPGTATFGSGPLPASFNIPGGGSHDFVWTYVNATPGGYSVTGGASGTDSNSGTVVSAPSVPSSTTTLQ
jgi:hypothetical protein